ncbi:Stromal Interaction Molecule 1 [Manis pentadactyla]|nr:Stromal Interaction Molecule 1 [Manis pentadactyla]
MWTSLARGRSSPVQSPFLISDQALCVCSLIISPMHLCSPSLQPCLRFLKVGELQDHRQYCHPSHGLHRS